MNVIRERLIAYDRMRAEFYRAITQQGGDANLLLNTEHFKEVMQTLVLNDIEVTLTIKPEAIKDGT